MFHVEPVSGLGEEGSWWFEDCGGEVEGDSFLCVRTLGWVLW